MGLFHGAQLLQAGHDDGFPVGLRVSDLMQAPLVVGGLQEHPDMIDGQRSVTGILAVKSGQLCDLFRCAADDPSGNVRFVPVLCPHSFQSIEEAIDDIRPQLWSEAVHLYETGMRANLPRTLKEAQREATERHRDRDEALEDSVLRAIAQVQTAKQPLTLTNIMTHCSLDSKSKHDQRRVRGVLKQAGYEQRLPTKIDGRTHRIWKKKEEEAL